MSDSGTLRSIAWRELFPWLIIFRSFSISLGLSAMLAALVGALLMPLGWKLSGALFLDSRDRPQPTVVLDLAERLGDINSRHNDGMDLPAMTGILPGSIVHNEPGDWSVTYQQLSFPVRQWFGTRLTVPHFAFFIFGGLWSLAVWAFCGGIIVRQAIVKLSVGERISIKSTVAHTVSKFLAYFSAPLFPLILVALITIPIALLGLIMRLGDVGAFIGALLWIFVLMGGLIMAITLLGLMFGWPLLWGAISSEKHSDSFDAVSRAYSYVYQRPLHYLFYAIVASLFGALCWILVAAFADAVIYLSWWSASFGLGEVRFAELQGQVRNLYEPVNSEARVTGFDRVIASLFVFWHGLVHLVATAFRYSFFWTVSAAIYLLLRYDADHTELDEVFLDDDPDPRTLPTLGTDEQGVPQAPASEPTTPAEESPSPESADQEKPADPESDVILDDPEPNDNEQQEPREEDRPES